MQHLATGQVVELLLVSKFHDQVGLNVQFFRVIDTTGIGVTDSEAAAYFSSNIAAPYSDLLTTEAEFRGAGVQVLRPLPPSPMVFSPPAAAVGTVGGPPVPSQVSSLISKKTNIATRRGRGRMYIPFPGGADVSATEAPTAGHLIRLGALATILFRDWIITVAGRSNTLRPVLWQKDTGVTIDIQEVAPSNKWATQRRRGDYGRLNAIPI